jgi:hypothetical protein
VSEQTAHRQKFVPHGAHVLPGVRRRWRQADPDLGQRHTVILRPTLREQIWDRICWAIIRRRERPWLTLVAVPLALAATMDVAVVLNGGAVFLSWAPLILAAWWWAPRSAPRAWLLAIEAGVLGVQWSLLGASALAAWPNSRMTTGAVWAGSAAVLAVVLFGARHRS